MNTKNLFCFSLTIILVLLFEVQYSFSQNISSEISNPGNSSLNYQHINSLSFLPHVSPDLPENKQLLNGNDIKANYCIPVLTGGIQYSACGIMWPGLMENYYGIIQVAVGGVDIYNNSNTCVDVAYDDKTNLFAIVQPSNSYILQVWKYSSSNYATRNRVWVDWNLNGDFNDAGELIVQQNLSSGSNLSYTTTINVPAGLADGDYRMRVATSYSSQPQPCSLEQGQAYDFTLRVVNPNLPPVANFSASKTNLCVGDCINFTDLSTYNPTQWAWVFDGATIGSSNLQNPTNICYNTPGTYTVQLTATNANGSDDEIKVSYINVYAHPAITASSNSPVCAGQTLTLGATTLPGTTYVWSGPNAFSSNQQNPSIANIQTNGSGTYAVTATSNGCTGTSNVSVTVQPDQTPTITSVQMFFCTNGPAYTFSANIPGGTWSGSGITNTSTGTFDPSSLAPGPYVITYTTSGNCSGSATKNIVILPPPDINLGPDISICPGVTATLDVGAGAVGYSFLWSTNETSQTIDITTADTYSVTVTDGFGCKSIDNIQVFQSNVFDPTITTSLLSYCENAVSVQFTAVDPGGMWVGDGVNSSGMFTPSVAGAGLHEIMYTIPGPCGGSSSVNVTVNPTPTVNLGPNTTICSGNSLTLDAGSGYSSYNWSPSGNTQTINVSTSNTYSVTVTNANSCTASSSIQVSVVGSANTTITTLPLNFCQNGNATQFTAVDPGGTWSGAGISATGLFTPSVAGTGSHLITYTIGGGCGSSSSVSVNVYANPTVSLGSNLNICQGVSATLDAGAGFTGYLWSPSGNTQTINVNSANTYSVTVTDANSCTASTSVAVNVLPNLDPTITTSQLDYCQNGSAVTFTAVDAGGIWTGTGINSSGLFTPSIAGLGSRVITYTIPGACGGSNSINVTVYAAPIVNLGSNTNICQGNTLTLDAGAGFSSYLWSPSGNTQTINISSANTYSVTVTDNHSCSASSSVIVNVLPSMDPTITTSQLQYCIASSPASFTSVDAGGIWTGAGINSSGIFNPVSAGIGTHVITYTIPGTCGGSNTVNVTVNPNPSVSLGANTNICNGSTYTLDAGSGYASYNWSPSGNTQTIQVTNSNTYSVTVTDNSLCTASSSVVINVLPSYDPTITTSPLSFCTNQSPITFTAVDAGGIWSGTGINAFGVFNPATAGTGTHTITYTIPGTCGGSNSVNVSVYSNPSVSLGANTSICNGQIQTLDAGSGFASYSWFPSGNTQTINVSQTNTYSVTITDVHNCSASSSVVITVLPNYNPSITTSDLNYCLYEQSVQFTAVDAGGTWSGNGISSSGLFNPSIAGVGNHQITYAIPLTCGGSNSVNVTVFQSPQVNLGSNTTICSGTSLILDAGSGFASYNWLPSGNSQTLTVTQANTYSVTVTDNNSCTASSSIQVNVTNTADPTITTSQLTYCSGDSPVQFTAVDAGGIWNGNGINTSGLFSPSLAGAGTHTITYTISGSCGGSSSVIVTVFDSPTISLGNNTTICSGTQYILDAGAGFSSYNWSPSGAGQTINVTSSNTYSVTVSDVNQCTATSSVTIVVQNNADPTITTSQLTFCTNENPLQFSAVDAGGTWSGTGINTSGLFTPSSAGVGTHTITYSISGSCGGSHSVNVTVNSAPTVNLGSNTTICSGTPFTLDAGAGFTNYSWSPSGNTQTINITQSDTYSVTVTDANSCSATSSVQINVVNSANPTITTSQLTFCNNESSLQFSAVDPGGVWSGNGINAGGLFNPTLAGSGNHTITYTISGSCGGTNSVSVTVNDAPTISLGNTLTICNGSSTILDAGPGFTSYIWFPAGNTQTISVTEQNTYSVTVTDNNSCSATSSVTVNVTSSADPTITTQQLTFCSNESAVQFTAVDNGGTWSGNGINSGGLFNPLLAGQGNHQIIYTIPGSCGGSDSVLVTVYQSPVVNLGTNTTICNGTSLTLDAGSGFVSYNWSPSGSTQTINVTQSNTYSVTVTDNNTCSASASVVITVLPQADPTITTSQLTYCSNSLPVQFNAAQGGGSWSGNGISGMGVFTPSLAGSGIHTITYSVPGQCGGSDSVDVTVFSAPLVNIGNDTSICEGNTLILDAGSGYSSYTWSPSGSSQTISVSEANTYSVTVSDINSCSGSATITVSVLPQADATVTSTKLEFCTNDLPYVFTAAQGNGVWSGSGISASGTFNASNAGTGNHNIIYTISGNCGDSDTVVVSVYQHPDVTSSKTDETCIPAADGTILVTAVGQNVGIIWSNGSNEFSLNNLPPGNYTYIVTDEHFCKATETVSIIGATEECHPPHFYIPNIFSPNRDNENDILKVRGYGIEKLEFSIYNRWGNKVFETTSVENGWDGQYQGQPADIGVYSYFIKVTLKNKQAETQSGTITLVR